ncbi:hypothetical protein H6771_02255 [Candidatus Peribacteria bacterium]|nr:hypothetical protein [Candidatus Peribacteria bacterium]
MPTIYVMTSNSMNRMVRLTSEITLADLENKQVSYEKAFLSQVEKWLIKPCERLLSKQDTDYRMSVFSILLMYFETHGQYLEGKTSQGKSKDFFIKSLREFIEFLRGNKLFEEEIEDVFFDNFYKFARCGLFHSTSMSNHFLIDCINFSELPISKNPIHGGFLINVDSFKDAIWDYAKNYIEKVENDSQLKKNFNLIFETLILKPLKNYSS